MRYPLLDQDFLRRLSLEKDKEIYAKIILLTYDELPVYEIQGKITAGSVNIDGASAVRRTCSLTMVSKDVDVNNTYWALKNKFKLEVGVENSIDSQYPDIIWFKQGIFLFTSLNMNVSSSNFTISINGKDKMCLLNGEVGGTINASTDFGTLEEYTTLSNGEIVRNITDIPIIEIVKNILHIYAGEPLHNIILNDIENYGLELLEYRGDRVMYMPRNIMTGEVSNLIINKKQEYYLSNGDVAYVDNAENLAADRNYIIYYDRTGLNSSIATKVWVSKKDIKDEEKAYNIIKIEYGETPGYRRTELTYPGELVANAGESLTTVLDKIKNMFSDFEYFYDIDGRFIFQKKKTYINTSFNGLVVSDDEAYVENTLYTSSTTYSFENGMLLSAFADSPQILNIKNDYSIWGKRKGVSGAEIPIHMRYAIDEKPKYYKPLRFKYKKIKLDNDTYEPNKYYIYLEVIDKYILSTSLTFDDKATYYTETDEQDTSVKPFTDEHYDWREIIYQMALDYFKYNHKKDNFAQLVAKTNPDYYPTGITGYEIYYTDMQGFWRQLHHPGAKSQNGSDKYYELFTRNELYEAAKELILRDRELIKNQDIGELIVNYIYDNFLAVRNNFIDNIDHYVDEEVDSERDYVELIQRCIGYGFTESSKVIKKLLEEYWKTEKMKDIDYKSLAKDEYSKNKKSDLYKTYIALSNYKTQQENLNKYTEAEIIQLIEKNIKMGETESSTVIQGLLSTRWNNLMFLYGEDSTDYLKLLENEYATNGDSALYKTYLYMYNYFNLQKVEYVNNDFIIMKETEKGKIEIDDPYLSFLYVARQDQINSSFGYGKYTVSNERLLWIIATIIKTFEKTKKVFKDSVSEMIQQQLNRDTQDFAQEVIDYIVENYDLRNQFFYINNKINKISVENAHIQYLLDMRQEKIQAMGEGAFYINNDVFVIVILETLGVVGDDSEAFATEVKKKFQSVYSLLDKTEYDFANEVVDYIYNNYEISENFIETKIENNNIIYEIKNQYLQFLFIMRQEKINELFEGIYYLQNDLFLTKIVETLEVAKDDKEKFKSTINSILDEFYVQTYDENYDFAAEMIRYICQYYSKGIDFFFAFDNKDNIYAGNIYAIDPYLSYLVEKRKKKIEKIKQSGTVDINTIIDTPTFVTYIVESMMATNNAEEFVVILNEKLK